MKTARGVAETRLTVEKLPKGHNSDKNQSSITSIKYDHLHVMGIITGKFHKNPLKTVGGVAETRLCPRTDGRKDGRTQGRTDEPKTIAPFDLHRRTITGSLLNSNDVSLTIGKKTFSAVSVLPDSEYRTF